MNKTVFFDLGNVLIFFSIKKMVSQLAELYGIKEEDAYRIIFESPLREEYEKGLITSEQIHQSFSEKAGKEIPCDQFCRAISDIFEPNLPVIALLEPLKAKGIELILLSNTCPAHFEFAKNRFPFLELFDHYILSYEVQAIKPEKKIFHCALSSTSSTIENCFYTDDIPEFIASARECGIDAELYTSPENLQEQLLIRSFIDIK